MMSVRRAGPYLGWYPKGVGRSLFDLCDWCHRHLTRGHPLSNVCGKGTGALGSCEYVAFLFPLRSVLRLFFLP
jgi:hypothetical protein